MNLKDYYWFFKKAIPVNTCNKIIEYALSKKENIGATGDLIPDQLTEKQLLDLKKQRDSNIVWLDDEWLYNLITPYINTANKNADWNFEWDWCENIQFTKYKLNQFYGWHSDSWEKIYDDKAPINFQGKIRKLSIIVALSDPNNYSGGEVQFDFRNKAEGSNIITCEEVKEQGSIVVFPSHVWHQVTPVTEGERYSLVCWTLGKPFK